VDVGARHLIAVGLKTESPDADYVSGDFFMRQGDRDLKSKIFGDAPGSREGSGKLPPPATVIGTKAATKPLSARMMHS
jgi:hypothetical protein